MEVLPSFLTLCGLFKISQDGWVLPPVVNVVLYYNVIFAGYIIPIHQIVPFTVQNKGGITWFPIFYLCSAAVMYVKRLKLE